MFLPNKNQAAPLGAPGDKYKISSPQSSKAPPHFELDSFNFSERDLLRWNSPSSYFDKLPENSPLNSNTKK